MLPEYSAFICTCWEFWSHWSDEDNLLLDKKINQPTPAWIGLVRLEDTMSTVVEFLKEFRQRSKPIDNDKPSDACHDRVLAMTAVEFRDANLAVLIRSYLLGEDICLVSNEKCKTLFGGEYVTYLPEELEAIYQLSPDFIKRVHNIKKLCDGEILKKGAL